jgi:HEPN domain-containing protein
MSDNPEVARMVRLWVQKAENDLTNATYMLTMEEDCPFDTVCFHAQQCVEKYLKALLTWLQIDFPKTHDLPELLLKVPQSFGLQEHLAGVSLLNRYAVEARYPGDWEPITREEAEEAVSLAERLRAVIRGHFTCF